MDKNDKKDKTIKFKGEKRKMVLDYKRLVFKQNVAKYLNKIIKR